MGVLPKGVGWLVVIFGIVLLFWKLGMNELGSADEAIHAQVAREMAREIQAPFPDASPESMVPDAASPVSRVADGSGWLYPTCRGEPYHEKPPLKFWLTAMAFYLFGESEFTARLGSGLFGLGTVLLVMALGGLMGGQRVGWMAGLVLLTHWEFLFNHSSRTGELDSALMFFSILVVWLTWKWRITGAEKYFIATAVALGLGVLTKGHAILLGLAWVPLVGIFSSTSGRNLNSGLWMKFTGLFAIVTLPWFLLQWMHYGTSFTDYLLWHHLLGYGLGKVEQARAPWDYFFQQWLLLDYPWPVLSVMGVGLLFRWKTQLPLQAGTWLMGWTVAVFLVFSFSPTKLPWYHLPVLIPLSLLAGVAGDYIWNLEGFHRQMKWVAGWLALYVGLMFFMDGFGGCAKAMAVAAWNGDGGRLADFIDYFLHDPMQQSVRMGVIILLGVLPVLGTLWLLRAISPVAREVSPARILLVIMAAMTCGVMIWEIHRPDPREKARSQTLAWVDLGGKLGIQNREIHVFDRFQSRAPHYHVSPALYYYLDGLKGCRVRNHPPTREAWDELQKEGGESALVVIPSEWREAFASDPGIQDFILFEQIKGADLGYLRLKGNRLPAN